MPDQRPEPVIIQISRQEVVQRDTYRVREILASFNPTLLNRNRHRVQFEVMGYEADPRELYDVPEVRLWFQLLFEEEDSLFYWMDHESQMFAFMGLMLYTPERRGGSVGLGGLDLQAYLVRGYRHLNLFCQRTQTSASPTNEIIDRLIGFPKS